MTFHLLVLSEYCNGEEDLSYSLWKTEQSAKSEMKYLVNYQGYELSQFDIIRIDAYD